MDDELEPVHLHPIQNPQPGVEGQVEGASWMRDHPHHHSGVDGFGGEPVEAEHNAVGSGASVWNCSDERGGREGEEEEGREEGKRGREEGKGGREEGKGGREEGKGGREEGKGREGRRERRDLLLQCEECKADVGYYLSLPAMASSPRLEVDYSFGELNGYITYVLKKQDKEANIMKPVEGRSLNYGQDAQTSISKRWCVDVTTHNYWATKEPGCGQ